MTNLKELPTSVVDVLKAYKGERIQKKLITLIDNDNDRDKRLAEFFKETEKLAAEAKKLREETAK